jgi:hypothetical protein
MGKNNKTGKNIGEYLGEEEGLQWYTQSEKASQKEKPSSYLREKCLKPME